MIYVIQSSCLQSQDFKRQFLAFGYRTLVDVQLIGAGEKMQRMHTRW